MPHAAHAQWHIHWAGGKFLLYLVVTDAIALVVMRVAGGICSRLINYGIDLVNVRVIGNTVGTPWTGRQIARKADIYRRFK